MKNGNIMELMNNINNIDNADIEFKREYVVDYLSQIFNVSNDGAYYLENYHWKMSKDFDEYISNIDKLIFSIRNFLLHIEPDSQLY